MRESTTTEQKSRPLRQQAQGVPGKRLSWIIAATVAIGIASVALSGWLLHHDRARMDDATARPIHAPGEHVSPIEHTNIRKNARGQRLHEEATARLHSYGWVDQETETIHIPIDDAMEWLLSDAAEEKAVEEAEAVGPDLEEDGP